MPYQGNTPAIQYQSIPTVQQFSGTGSATTFTLDRSVSSIQDVLVSVDGVVQDANESYTIPDGVTLTFSAAPSSGTDNIFVNYLGKYRLNKTVVLPHIDSEASAVSLSRAVTLN